MAATAGTFPTTRSTALARESLSLPWFLKAVLFAATSITVGVVWDICWHQTIGRDTFWSPPHMAIYLGGIVAGLSSAAVIFRTTFAGSAAEQGQGVRVLRFSGPLGAFVCAWGAGAMITSAPFDDWWHNTYGLDVKIISPPHILLALGINGILIGAMLAAVALQNRQADTPDGERMRSRLALAFTYGAGIAICNVAITTYEYSSRALMHSSIFYLVTGGAFPLLLVATARASRRSWAAATTAAVYMALMASQVWLMPLFAAEPKLGPVRQHITHMVPMEFPLLLVLPALALDLVLRRWKGSAGWALAALLGTSFLVVMLAVQWPLGSFLISPASEGWAFGTAEFPYFASPRWYPLRHLFAPYDATHPGLLLRLLLMIPVATLSARLGLALGGWMTRVQR